MLLRFYVYGRKCNGFNRFVNKNVNNYKKYNKIFCI